MSGLPDIRNLKSPLPNLCCCALGKPNAQGRAERRALSLPAASCGSPFSATRDGSHHGKPKIPAFRARCLRLAPQDPRRTSFQDRSPVLSTAAGRRQRPGQYDAAQSLRRHIPSDARCGASGPHGLGRRDKRASHAPSRPPHPAPHLMTLIRRPLRGTGWRGL